MDHVSRKIRLSQVVSTFGVGAIYDVMGESLILCDISQWEATGGVGRRLKGERLLQSLQAGKFGYVQELRQPGEKLPYFRFPQWLFCPECRGMVHRLPQDETDGQPVCLACSQRKGHRALTPMRFIAICDHGHMSDVPWDKWAHSAPDPGRPDQISCRSTSIRFLTGFVKNSSLESVTVQCTDCEAFRDLGQLPAKNMLSSIRHHCTGRQPWQSTQAAVRCERPLQVVQRGAGNVYFPEITSAITIPPESNYTDLKADLGEMVRLNPLFRLLTDSLGKPVVAKALSHRIAVAAGSTADEVMEIAQGRNPASALSGPKDASHGSGSLEADEWNALTQPNPEQTDQDLFVTRHLKLGGQMQSTMASRMAVLVDKLVSVVRLRELRALTGFSRYEPAGTDGESKDIEPVRPDLNKNINWLPTTEVFGEGIFLTLNEQQLQEWESHEEVLARTGRLGKNVEKSGMGFRLPDVTPRFLLLHTLAHLLIRRLAFDCGYAAASLRERIYCSGADSPSPQAGILIYTAAGDAEGTLGGLARQAEPERLTATVAAALQDAVWCSTDPICMESSGQGLAGLNLAACHACALVAETSCIHMNSLLDRGLVVGDGLAPGYFEQWMKAAMDETVIFSGAL